MYVVLTKPVSISADHVASSASQHAYIVTFRSKEDRDHYLTDPAHLEFVEFIKDKVDMAKVKVADFETGTF